MEVLIKRHTAAILNPPSCGWHLTNWNAQSDAQFSRHCSRFPRNKMKSRVFLFRDTRRLFSRNAIFHDWLVALCGRLKFWSHLAVYLTMWAFCFTDKLTIIYPYGTTTSY